VRGQNLGGKGKKKKRGRGKDGRTSCPCISPFLGLAINRKQQEVIVKQPFFKMAVIGEKEGGGERGEEVKSFLGGIVF